LFYVVGKGDILKNSKSTNAFNPYNRIYNERVNNIGIFIKMICNRDKCGFEISNPPNNKALYGKTHFVVEGRYIADKGAISTPIFLVAHYESDQETEGQYSIMQDHQRDRCSH